MSEMPGSGSGGLLAASKNSAATLLAVARTRLDLLGNELKEEKLRAVRLVLLAQVLVFCSMIGTILAVALLIIVFWDNRVLVLGGFTALFLVSAGFAYAAVQRSMRTLNQLFAASIAELGEDLRRLKGAASNESKAD